jgi:hypothetical protein
MVPGWVYPTRPRCRQRADSRPTPYTWFGSSIPTPKSIGIYLNNGDVLEFDPIIATTATVTIEVQDSEQHYDDENFTQQVIFLPAPLPTTTTLASTNTTAGTGGNVTFTATVTPSSGVTPTGQVFFYNGTTSLGYAALDANGNATLQTSFATIGVYSITAVYTGNGTYAASTSSPLTEAVVTPGITTAVNPVSLTVKSGSSGQLVITVTPVGGYAGTIAFSCGALPAHVSCAFAPPSLVIAAGSGPVTDTLTVSTSPPLAAMLVKPPSGETRNSLAIGATFWFPGSLTALLGLARRNRRRVTARPRNLWIIAILCVAGAGALAGCGSPTNNNAKAGTYTISITLNLAGGAAQNISATVIVE